MKQNKKPAAGKTAAKKTVKKSSKPKVVKSTEPGFEHLPADAVEFVPATPEPEKTGKQKFMEKVAMRNDNIFVESKIMNLSDLTGMPCDTKCSKAIVSEGKIVATVSPSYGFMPNERFFAQVETHLIEADLKYITRSVNRGNKHFSVDYILSDESYHINVKNSGDKIIPMLRFTNSYAGGPVSGSFGIYREICSNGLHIAQTNMGFKFRHKSTVMEVTMPRIKETVEKFRDNEFYSLHKKFEVLAERLIPDMTEFVKFTCTELDLFKYEASNKNPDTPGAKAKLVMDTMTREAQSLGTPVNYWLGYNAFNEVIHADKKSFGKQAKNDQRLFNSILELATN